METALHLERLPFSAVLNEKEKRLLTQAAYYLSFARGEVVHTRSQADCLGLVILLSGSLCASMMSDEGKQIMLYRVQAGETCVFGADCALNLLSYEAVVEGEVAGNAMVIPLAALTVLQKNPQVQSAINLLTVQRSVQIINSLERMLFSRVDKRLAHCLLREAERQGKTDIKLTHEQLARDISSAREVVSRVLAKFSKEGLVKGGRGKITILDLNGLKAYQ